MKYEKLGDIVNIQIGKTPKRSELRYWGEGFPWLSISDMKTEVITKTKEQITKEAVIECGCKLIKKGTLLMSFKLSVGKLAFAGTDLYTNEAICGLLLKKPESINPKYLYYALKNTKMSGSNIAAKGITLNSVSLANLQVPFYENVNHQIRIAEILSKSETLIKQRKESIDLLDEFIKSTFLEMFGNVLTNSKNWPLYKFIDLVKLKRGFDLPIQSRAQGNFPVFASSSIIDFHNEYKVTGPGIITGRSGTIGIVNYSKVDFWPLNTTLYSEKLDGNVIYIKYFLEQFKLDRFSNGAGVPTLNRNLLHNEKIIKVPIELQNQFATTVEKVENLKKEYETSLMELENMNSVLSYKAFKGELFEIEEETNENKKKSEITMEEQPNEEINIEKYVNNLEALKNTSEKRDITNMTFAEFLDFPEELQIKHEKWMFTFLEDDEFYQFLLKDGFRDTSFTLGDIEMKFHDFFYHGGDMDFDNEKWKSVIFKFMEVKPPIIEQYFDEETATIKLKLTDEAYKA